MSVNETTTGTTEDDTYDYDYYAVTCNGSASMWQTKAASAIELYVFPIVVIVGFVCNILSFVTLQSRAYRGKSTGFLMSALAVADIGLLLSGILRRWINELTAYDLRTISALGCKFNIFFTYFFQYLSAWTLALITIERAICVYNPFMCRELCSLKRIVIGYVVVFVAMFAVNMQFFWTYVRVWDDVSESYVCDGVKAHYKFLYGGAHNWLDLVLPCFGPFAVIIGCNGAIIGKLVASAAERRKMSVPGTDKTSSTTVMLLVVSVSFLLLVGPFAIFALGEAYLYWPFNDASDCANLTFLYSFTYLLFNLNSAINFLLYCASGTKFRRTLVSVFCPRMARRSRRSTYANGTATGNGATTSVSEVTEVSSVTGSNGDGGRNGEVEMDQYV